MLQGGAYVVKGRQNEVGPKRRQTYSRFDLTFTSLLDGRDCM